MFGYLEPKTLHIASVGALVSLACIFSVALSRNPAGFFRHLPGVAGS
jgi:integral membrane sensor domain MASE1